MRVLWLTQTQLPAATREPSMIFGGWHEGLRSALEEYEPSMELGIVSWGPVQHEPFQRGNATYFSLHAPPANSRVRRVTQAWRMSAASPRAIEEAAAIARRFRPDIVHIHGTEHFLGLAALRLPFPAVATLQGIATAYERFVLDGFSWSEVIRCVATRDFVRGTSPVHAYAHMRRRAQVERQIVSGLSYFMGQTDWDRDVLKLLNPSAVYFRTECIMQRDFYEDGWRQPERPWRTIYCTSGAAPYKGLEMLIEAVALLRAGSHADVRLRVAGPIPNSMMWATLVRLARRRGVEGLLTWLGPLPASELVVELKGADVYVLPSHIENQPNSLLEAMLLGVPCVAASVGGVAELVEHGVSGLVYHDSDPFALASAIARVLDDPEFARSLGATALSQAHARYEREAVAHRTRDIYQQILTLAASARSVAAQQEDTTALPAEPQLKKEPLS
jgi:glycosyltransferase involved in cell wall biosynthesis